MSIIYTPSLIDIKFMSIAYFDNHHRYNDVYYRPGKTYFYDIDKHIGSISFSSRAVPDAKKIVAIYFDEINVSEPVTKEYIIEKFKKIDWNKFTVLETLCFNFDLMYLLDYIPDSLDVAIVCDVTDVEEMQKLIETELHRKIIRIKINKIHNCLEESVLVADEFNKKAGIFLEMLPSHIESVIIELGKMNVDTFNEIKFNSLPFSLKKLYISVYINTFELPDDLVGKFGEMFTLMPATELISLLIYKKTRLRVDSRKVIYKNGEVKIES